MKSKFDVKTILSVLAVAVVCSGIGYGLYDFNSTIEITEVIVNDKEVVKERTRDEDSFTDSVDYYYYIYTNKGKLKVEDNNYGFTQRDPHLYTMIKTGKRYRMTLRGWKGWTRIIDEAREIKPPVKAEVETMVNF